MLSEARADHKESDEVHMRRKCECRPTRDSEFGVDLADGLDRRTAHVGILCQSMLV